MAKTRIAINGFGRIGRAAFKIASEKKDIEIIAINNTSDPETASALLQRDSVYGHYEKKVSFGKDYIKVGSQKIKHLSDRDPANLPWKKLKIDVVLECTGAFTKDGAAKVHLKSGAKRVIVSAPTKGTGGVKTYLRGVNEEVYKDDQVISNASCTTNCIGPVISVVDEKFGIEKALMTTVHAYTSSQNLLDDKNKDLRKGRAAAQNIIPTTTGAAISTTEVITHLKNKFDGMALRVPVSVGSITDFTMLLKKKTTVDEINRAFTDASKQPRYKGILAVSNDPLVSSDIIGSSYSSIVDLPLTKVVDGDFVKIYAWYDNEWGYANRLVEQITTVMNT